MPLSISVVVPTFNRRVRVERCLRSLEAQTLAPASFEVIVVVDGSSDGTEGFLQAYRPPYPFRFVVQENRGLSAARNHGNRLACSPLVLCLDDDMDASPRLLAEHVRAHAEGGPLVVQGGLDLHGSVERTPFIRYDEKNRERFAAEKSEPGAVLDGEDVSGGNLSLPRALLDSVGGFNEGLRGLRNTDGELAFRLTKAGARIVYRHAALAHMTHTNDLGASLRGSYLYGRSYVFTARQHPETRWKLSPLVGEPGLAKGLLRRLYLRPRRAWGHERLERALLAAISLAEGVGLTALAEPLYRLALDVAYCKGVHEESGGRLEDFLPRPVPVLCYHDVSDRKRFRFRHYILPVRTFARQVRWLKERGYTALSLDALYAYLEEGGPLPERPVLITFDDGYQDLKTTATPVLAAAGFRHTHFLTTGKLGGTTDWVETAPDLPILSADDVREMAERFGEHVDFQAHGKDHRSMEGLPAEPAKAEVLHSIATIEPLTGQKVRYLAYPFGDYDERTPAVMRELPIRASFTVDRGLVRPGQDPHLLPRVEVFSNDFGFDFRCKVRHGWSPLASLRITVGHVVNAAWGTLAAAARGPRSQTPQGPPAESR